MLDVATQQITFFQCNLMQLRTHKVKGISIKRCNNKSSENGIKISPLLLFGSHFYNLFHYFVNICVVQP
jgi:hypothetical protein